MWPTDLTPRKGATKWQVFTPQTGAAAANSISAWQKPYGCSWIFIFMQASGGGGGNGFLAGSGNPRGGGGGGGAGGCSRVLIPAFFLPDTLYVRPGKGGAAVTAGAVSFVSTQPATTTQSYVVTQNGGAAGGTGTGAAAGAAGAAGAIGTATGAPLQAMGFWISVAGEAGIIGGAQTGANGGNRSVGASGIITSGGASGAGCSAGNFNGGNITGAGFWPTITGGVNGANGEPGLNHGITIPTDILTRTTPLIFSGGSGGSALNTGIGGNGGPGAYGGGGGGGGAGATSAGIGGTGGDGFVIIGAW